MYNNEKTCQSAILYMWIFGVKETIVFYIFRNSNRFLFLQACCILGIMLQWQDDGDRDDSTDGGGNNIELCVRHWLSHFLYKWTQSFRQLTERSKIVLSFCVRKLRDSWNNWPRCYVTNFFPGETQHTHLVPTWGTNAFYWGYIK